MRAPAPAPTRTESLQVELDSDLFQPVALEVDTINIAMQRPPPVVTKNLGLASPGHAGGSPRAQNAAGSARSRSTATKAGKEGNKKSAPPSRRRKPSTQQQPGAFPIFPNSDFACGTCPCPPFSPRRECAPAVRLVPAVHP